MAYNAKISDIRKKTSNGCEVAQCVARTDAGCRFSSNYVAAIDFGTTNCSVAYILPGDMGDQGPVMLPFDGNFYRVPTAILFSADGGVEAFGITARKTYRNLDDDERLKRAYFEQIKMDLQHDENINREMKVQAKNGKEYYLVEVIAHILKYLKDELIRVLRGADLELEATEFDWVITVPAIWRARGKQMMREAGYKAGLCSRECCPALQVASDHIPEQIEEDQPDKLSLALEPESAAIFCQYSSQRQVASFCSYLIVDIGGGTVDISAHRFIKDPQPHIKVIHPPTGNDCGGTRVNREFERFLQKLVRDSGFAKFVSTPDVTINTRNQVYLNELLNETFERQKKAFGDKISSSVYSIQLPTLFIKTYLADLRQGVAERGGSLVKLVDQDLRISNELMSEFFKPVTDGIIKCIHETLEEVSQVDKIYLVGWFGGTKYMVKTIQDKFNDRGLKYVVPVEPAYAVARGAALFKQNPSVIESRKADATYGLGTNSSFIDGLHDPKYKWTDDDGKLKCKKLFSTIVECGDIVNTGEVLRDTFYPVEHGQKSMSIAFYSSQETDIFYVTGEWGKNSHRPPATVTKIGKIIILMPDLTGDKNRAVDMTYDFSHTEIQVKAFDRTSGNEVKTVLNFLTVL